MAIFGVELSTGTLDNFRACAARRLGGFVDMMRQSIIDSLAGFFDETGIKVKAAGHWIHVAATSLFCLFILHAKRGRIAREYLLIFGEYCTGTIIIPIGTSTIRLSMRYAAHILFEILNMLSNETIKKNGLNQ